MPKKSQGGCSGSSSRNALGTQLPEAGGRIQQAPSFCAGFLALSSRVAGATDLCLWKRGEVGRAETSFSGSVSGDRKEGRGPHVPQGPQKAHEKMSLFLCKKKKIMYSMVFRKFMEMYIPTNTLGVCFLIFGTEINISFNSLFHELFRRILIFILQSPQQKLRCFGEYQHGAVAHTCV